MKFALPLSLEQKVTLALKTLKKLTREYEVSKIALAFTGGKDSTVALHLWRIVCSGLDKPIRPFVINLDTGYKFPEVLEFRDNIAQAWKINLHIIKASAPKELNIGQNVVECCHELKIKPLTTTIVDYKIEALITGLRADENPNRANLPQKEQHSAPNHIRLHPVLNFTEMDIWAYIQSRNLPYCNLYEKGYRSLGCIPCTKLPEKSGTERSGRHAAKEQKMNELRELGYF